MALSTQTLILLFIPWACAFGLGHVAKRDFRAHLRRRHPQAYRAVYGVHADRGRHSALDPLAWLLQLRFELSNAWSAIGDAQLSRLGQRLRRLMLSTMMLYCVAIGCVLGAASAHPPAAPSSSVSHSAP